MLQGKRATSKGLRGVICGATGRGKFYFRCGVIFTLPLDDIDEVTGSVVEVECPFWFSEAERHAYTYFSLVDRPAIFTPPFRWVSEFEQMALGRKESAWLQEIRSTIRHWEVCAWDMKKLEGEYYAG